MTNGPERLRGCNVGENVGVNVGANVGANVGINERKVIEMDSENSRISAKEVTVRMKKREICKNNS